MLAVLFAKRPDMRIADCCLGFIYTDKRSKINRFVDFVLGRSKFAPKELTLGQIYIRCCVRSLYD